MKKIITMLLACLMIIGLFAGCTGGTGNTEVKEVTLTVWAPSEDQVDENSWLQTQLKKFEAAHPEYKITWNLGVCPEGDALTKVQTDVAAAADVFMYANDQLGGMMQAEALAKLGGDYLKQVQTDNSQTLINTVTYTDGGVYGFPFTNNTWFMYYNKDVYSEEDIKSLDTMLTKGTVAFPLTNSWYIGAFYVAGGATMFGDKGIDASAGIQLGENATAVTNYLIDLAANPNFKLDDKGQGLNGLKDGSVAAMFSGSWDAENVKAALGDKMGVAQLPCITLNGQQAQLKSFAGSKAIGVNKQSKNMAIAMQVAAFLASTDAQKAKYEMRGVIPAASALASDPAVSSNPVAVGESNTMSNTSIGQPTIPEMGDWWTPAADMGTNIVDKKITHDNAKEKTELFQEQLTGKNGL